MTKVEEILYENFFDNIVYKDPNNQAAIRDLKLPSFLRDWVLHKFQDENGDFDSAEVLEYLNEYRPTKEDWPAIRTNMQINNEKKKILAKIKVDSVISTNEILFTLPDYSLAEKDTIIDKFTWKEHNDRGELKPGREEWGVCTLGYREPTEKKEKGKIVLLDFIPFQPYEIDLDDYRELRKLFTFDEWLDVLLSALDYNPAGYESNEQKLAMISRLLPFVEKNLNLIELAPPGTGKSYVFGSFGKNGVLIDGGKVTRAKMFYDLSSKQEGFIVNNDFVAIDEVKHVTFDDDAQMRSSFQGYLENGKVSVNGHEIISDASLVFLGNIDEKNSGRGCNKVEELPALFHSDGALLDRFNCYLDGFSIPRMNENLKMNGWGINSEYFSSVLHLLRDENCYSEIVKQLVKYPENESIDTRSADKIKKTAAGFMKLLFPDAITVEDMDADDFYNYCLRPAMNLRSEIIDICKVIDNKFNDGKHEVPNLEVNRV